jgi:DNA-binding MarR family transcriptional regulator
MPIRNEFTLSETIIKTSNRLRAIANRFVFRGSGITGAQFCILRLLSKKKAQNATAILKIIGGTKSNLSQRIKSLERLELISRFSKEGSDRRNIYFKLNSKGQKLVASLIQRFQKAARSFEHQFLQKEVEAQFQFLVKLNAMLDKNEEKLPQIFQK